LYGLKSIPIEIVSSSSVEADTEWLVPAYHNAGIMEYWIIDALKEAVIRFDIFRNGKNGHHKTRKEWLCEVRCPILTRFLLSRINARRSFPTIHLGTSI
jgi:Uma2 family endonuclease